MTDKQFRRLKRGVGRTLCAISLCGLMTSCSDDYKWDDTNPAFLNTSIYEYLETQGKYTNFIKLINDLDYKNVLEKTGSKTLFVADDDAFTEFYADNEWGVKSYADLTLPQKKLILNSSMVNNAYLLEMMSSTVGPVKGQCLRRETALTVLDSVPHFKGEDLPINYNADDKDYWARFRSKGIYMALDNTAPMMVHFLPTQMQNKGITDNDFKIVVGQERDKNDAFIYDSKVLEQDITCQNGYINRLDKVLITPQNMAEMLRTNGQTNIFSHMIERFAAPFYSRSLTESYRLLYGNDVDSVFEKRYFSIQDYRSLKSDAGTDPTGNPQGQTVNFGLSFDPGWNAYQPSDKISKEQDMGVIFAPTDERLYDYFFNANGGGRFLLEAYAPTYLNNVKGADDYENIYKAIDQIPRSVIQALTNNLMKDQFCEAVPSKFETIKDDAQDPMLDASHLDKIKKVMLANNGAIYLMDEVLTPAQYAAVSAPAYVSNDMKVMNYAIQSLKWNGEDKNFYAYLLAMSSRFSLFVPRDGFWYIDPASFALGENMRRAIYFEWNDRLNTISGTSYKLDYDFTTDTYTIDKSAPITTGAATTNELYDRLNDILETHTIVHEDNTGTTGIDETATGIECNKHYFLSKNGAPIYVENAEKRANGMRIQGAWAKQHGEWNDVTRFDDKTRETNGNGNGMAYQTDGPIIPAIESVYSVMYNNRDTYGEFFNLCLTDNEDILEMLEPYLNRDEEGNKIYSSNTEYTNRYSIFVRGGGLPCFDKETGSQASTATNVRFFNNYRYTVYLPNNAAVEQAEAQGLPTWESIREYLELDKEPEDRTELTEEQEAARCTKAAAMVTTLMNFIKYHFQDNSIFVDAPTLHATEYETATLDSETGIYRKVTVSGGNGTLQVRGSESNNVVRVDSKFNNKLVRDYVLTGTGNSRSISSSSFAVVHGIDGTLHYKTLTNGRYDTDWANTTAAKRLLKRYRIQK